MNTRFFEIRQSSSIQQGILISFEELLAALPPIDADSWEIYELDVLGVPGFDSRRIENLSNRPEGGVLTYEEFNAFVCSGAQVIDGEFRAYRKDRELLAIFLCLDSTFWRIISWNSELVKALVNMPSAVEVY